MIEQVAEARRSLADAEASHSAAHERVSKIQGRIGECQARQREITQQRLEGEASPETAAEYAALGGDIETLSAMLVKAQQEVTAIQPAVEEAHRRLAFLEQQATRQLAQAEFDAISTVIAKLEFALCDAIAKAHQIGKARLGHHALSEAWKPTEVLHRAVHYGVPPTVGG